MSVPNPNKLSLAAVKLALYHWVKRECESVIPADQIVWRNQSEPMPPRPCVTMKITSGPKRTGYSDNVTYLSGDNYIVGGQREMVVSVQIFGNTQIHKPMAYQLAIDLNASLSKVTVLDRLRASGVAVFNQGEVDNITALEETEFEERAAFDVLLGVAENVVDDPGIIEHVNLENDVHG